MMLVIMGIGVIRSPAESMKRLQGQSAEGDGGVNFIGKWMLECFGVLLRTSLFV